MLYCCETCGKKFTTEEQALDCERVHSEEKAKRDELEKVRKERVDDINEAFKVFEEKYNQYRKDYCSVPVLRTDFFSNLLFKGLF